MDEQEIWKHQVIHLETELTASQFQSALDVITFEKFNGTLQYLFLKYSKSSIAKLVNEKIAPYLDHIKSFEKAISASTQQIKAAGYVWSALLAVIECACRHTEHMQAIFDQLGGFCQTFPLFDQYLHLFPNSTSLRLVLRDLYQIYSEFSLHTIKYMGKSTVSHVLKNLISSGPRKRLQDTLKKWNSSKEDFERYATWEFRSQVITSSDPTAASAMSMYARSTHARTSNVPPQHTYFTGREELLNEIHDDLLKQPWVSPSEPRSCLIHAMGGMGKTQAALAYCHKFEKHYDYRFWVKAETSERLTESFSSICDIIRINSALPSYVDEVKHWLETTDKSWLLVFDNVEEQTFEALRTLKPTQCINRSAIILTSQLEQGKHDVQHSVPLRSLGTEDCVQLLIKCLRRDPSKVVDEERKVLEEVSDLLGGLPLAIVHIGGYISESRHNLTFFRDYFKSRWQYAWGATTMLEQNNKKLEIVWDLALQELPANARKLIDIMAYLNPDEIPEKWLASDIAEDPDWGFPKDNSVEELLDLTRALTKRCLVDLEDSIAGNAFSIHRTLQAALQHKLDKDPDQQKRGNIFRHALAIVVRASPKAHVLQIPDPSNWARFQESNPHALTLCRAFKDASPPLQPSLDLANLLYYAGFHIWEKWNPVTVDGTFMLETAEMILDRLGYDRDGKLRADIACMKALLLDILGLSKRSESLQCRQEARRIREIIFRNDSPSTATKSENEHLLFNALNDLALSYLQLDRYQEAETLFDQCFAKYPEWGTELDIPYEYAKYYHNMGLVRMYQGRFSEAIQMSEKGIAIKERTDGQDNSRYWWFQYDIACIMMQAGRIDDALKKHVAILSNRQRICGSSKEVTLQSLYTVGATYHHLKDLPNAELHLRECINKARNASWHNGALARTKFHLARVLKEQNKDLIEAERLSVEARQTLTTIYASYGSTPDYLKYTDDEMILFDWTQPSFDGRWTGSKLLPIVHEHFAKTKSP